MRSPVLWMAVARVAAINALAATLIYTGLAKREWLAVAVGALYSLVETTSVVTDFLRWLRATPEEREAMRVADKMRARKVRPLVMGLLSLSAIGIVVSLYIAFRREPRQSDVLALVFGVAVVAMLALGLDRLARSKRRK